MTRLHARSPASARVAFLAGTLSRGGAEKQLFYMVKALREVGVAVQVYTLEKEGAYRKEFESLGVVPMWVGRHKNPALRLANLVAELRRFRPHVVHSAHTYCNLYASITSGFVGAISIGALRSSLEHTMAGNGAWTKWHLRTPSAVIVNSRSALNQLMASKSLSPGRVHCLPNVVEVHPDALVERVAHTAGAQVPPTIILVARLVKAKRVDLFLQALSLARTIEPYQGVVVGDGPEREPLERLAEDLGLKPSYVTFLGERDDVADLLQKADLLVLSSETEGFPNVLLEAMAAGLPTITTPAGDAEYIVEDSRTGYVVPFGGVQPMADRMVELLRAPELRRTLGDAGLKRVQQCYSFSQLAGLLFEIYSSVARRCGNIRTQDLFAPDRILRSQAGDALRN